MKKRFVIVFIMVLCLLTFVGCLGNEAEKVLAMGVRQKPDVVNYEVGMPLDVTGGKVAVVYDNEPTEIVMFDLTEAMINKESYNIHVPGTYDVEVIYYFGGEKYSATYEVEYAVKGYKTNAIDVINAYKQDVVYSADGEDVVEAIKSLAVINVKLSNNEKEVKAVVANAKQKIDAVPTKAQEDFNNKPSASLVQAQANAIAEIENYCLKDKNGNVITYPDLYAQIISANRTIGKAEIKAAESVEEVQIAVITAKANIDNAVLGNKTLDEINSSKVAADAAASVAQTQAGIAANKASEAQSAKDAAVAAKDAAESAKAKAESAKAKAEGAQAKSETAQKAAEAAQKAAEAAKKAVEDIQKDINATKAEINKAKEDAQKAQVAAEKAKAEAEKAQQAAVKAKDEAVVAQQAAETAKTAAEAAKVAAELAQTKAETAQAKAEAAAQAAEEAKKAAADILEEIKGIYNQIPSAAAAIAEVNGYVQDADYAGIYKLLVQNTKTSFVAAIKMAKTDAEVNELVAAAKAQLDQIADKTSIGAAADAEAALELEAAKLSAKAEFKEYVNILDFQKPAGAPFPGEEYPENPDQQQLLDVINALITEIEAEIDAAQSVSEVNVALAKGMGQAHLETIYVDFYSSYLVQNLGKKFRAEYESIKASYSKENYEQLLQIMDFYVTYIGRIDKLDQLNAKYAQALEELDAIKTQSEEIADMIFDVSLPILIEVETGDFDSKRDELDAIEAKLVEFGVRAGTNLRCIDELENYPDPQDPNATINMIALFDKYLARYAELETAKANANVAATGVIALIDALTAKELIVLVVDKPFVEAARDAYDLWIDTFFTNAATGSYDVADVMEALNTRLVKNYAKLQEAEARIAQLEAAKAAAPAVDALIEAIIDEANGEYITLADEAEFFAAEQAYCDWMQQYEINEAVTPVNADFVTLRGVLATYKERLDVLNQAKAAAEATDGAIALIDAIIDEANGEYITLADETEFAAAEQAYCDWMAQYAINETLEPLNADIVSNRADLAAYKARIDVLQQAKAAAPAVDALIDAVVPTGAVTLDDLAALEAAEAAYEAWLTTYAIDETLEPLNADMVEGREDLVAYREKYEALKISVAAVEAAIDAIGSVNINSENSIDNAEKLYQKLVVENNGVDASAYVDYATLLSSRAELEALLYGEYRANAYNEISELINKIVDQMGSSRNITERHNVKAAGNTALTLINDSVAAPVAPSPYEFGAWEAQRTAYEQAFDNIIKDSKNSLYKAAIYLVSGDSTNGYDVNIYAEGTYSKFITKEGESIKAVKDLYIDATVGTGHVELQGLSISGTVYVNGGGSSSVVFKDCVVGSIEVNYEGVRVELNADVHVNEKVVLGNNLDSSKEVILDVKGAELKDVEVYCAAQIKGTKADVTTNVAVKAEVALKIDAAILADAKFEKAEDVEEYQINSTPVDSEVLEVAKDGTVTVSAPAIELDSNKTDGKLAYVIEGTAIEFGGEGQKLVYNNGYRLGVKITAPALVEDYAKAVVTVNGEAYTPVMNGNFFDYVFEVAEAPYEVVIKVLWMEGLNEFTYTVKVLEGTNLDISAGDFTADEAKVAGPNAVVVAEKTTLTVSGELKYYAANEAYEGAEAGYYFGYKLVPDAALEAETEEKVIKVTAEILANGYEFTKVYEAEEKEFTYNVVFDATLEVPAAKVEKYGEDYEETLVEVEGKVITVKGLIPYILADEALGRAAGYRVGLLVVPTEGVAFNAKLVKVDGDEIAIDSELYYFVPVNPEAKEYTFEIKWNPYSEAEVYTLVIDAEAEFEVPAPEQVVVTGEATVKTSETVTFAAEVFPKYASQEVVWSVTPASVAKIDSKTGVLTGLWKGTATVTAKAVADNSVIGEFEVTVEVQDYSIEEIVEMTPKTTNAADKVAVSFDGVIVSLQYKGYWVADETGLLLVYTNTTTYPKVGTYVQVTGKVTTYQQANRFTCQISDSSYVALEGEAPKYELTATPYELAESYEKGIDSLAKAKESGYYGKVLKVKGTISGSGNYWYISDAEGHRFYISSAYSTSALKAGYEAELDLLVREVYYVKDSSTYNNYDACTLGGFYLGTPTVYAKGLTVDSTVEAGSTTVVGGLSYVEGVNIFATIQEAVNAAKEGDEIVVKAGTYADNLTIDKKVTLVGPNAGKHGTDEDRTEEAIIDVVTEVNGANTTIDGLKFTKAIKVGADFVTITNCVVDPTATIACNGNNRKGCIVDSANISDLTVKDNYIDAPGTENSYLLQFMSFTHVTNLAILNNYITNSEQSKVSYDFEGMILYYAYGTLDIIDNIFAWGTDGYIFNLGYYGNYCSDVNIIDNEFTHNGIIKQNATIWFRRTQNAEANINIIGNSFIAFKGTTLLFNNAAKAPVINVKYNYFDAETSYKASSGNGYPTIVTENNYYAAAQKTATSDYGVITSKEELDAAYAATKEPVEVFAGTISFADKANRVSFSTSKQVWSQNGITVTNNKDKSTSNVADYANPVRFYKSSQVVVEHEKKISKIVIKTTGGEKYQILASDVFAGAELSVSGTTATLVLAEASNSYSFNCSLRQLRVASIDVYVLE